MEMLVFFSSSNINKNAIKWSLKRKYRWNWFFIYNLWKQKRLWLWKQCSIFSPWKNIYFKLLVHFNNCLIVDGSECKLFAIESISSMLWELKSFRIYFVSISFFLQNVYWNVIDVHLQGIQSSTLRVEHVYLHNWMKIKSINDICIRNINDSVRGYSKCHCISIFS